MGLALFMVFSVCCALQSASSHICRNAVRFWDGLCFMRFAERIECKLNQKWLELFFWSWLRSVERKFFTLLHIGSQSPLYIIYLSKLVLPICSWSVSASAVFSRFYKHHACFTAQTLFAGSRV